jgi:hypothetical protein
LGVSGLDQSAAELIVRLRVFGDLNVARRLLEPIGYVPPAEYEARYYEQASVA